MSSRGVEITVQDTSKGTAAIWHINVSLTKIALYYTVNDLPYKEEINYLIYDNINGLQETTFTVNTVQTNDQ